MKVICNNIGQCEHCKDCGAAQVHDKMGCEQCPVLPFAYCIEVEETTEKEGMQSHEFFFICVASKTVFDVNRRATEAKMLFRLGKNLEGKTVPYKVIGKPKYCQQSCSPSDYCPGGKCDVNGCFKQD